MVYLYISSYICQEGHIHFLVLLMYNRINIGLSVYRCSRVSSVRVVTIYLSWVSVFAAIVTWLSFTPARCAVSRLGQAITSAGPVAPRWNGLKTMPRFRSQTLLLCPIPGLPLNNRLFRHSKLPLRNLPSQDKAEAHQERSFALLKDGHYGLAIDELTKAIQYDPGKAIVYLLRGGAYYKKGEYDKALPDLDKAIELDSNLPAAFYNRGSIFYYRKQFDRAIADFSRAIAMDNRDPGAYHNRGCAFIMRGQYDKAIDDLSRAIELDTSDPRVYCSRGRAYIGNGQETRAAEDFRKAISMTSDPDVIQKAEEILRELGAE